MASDSWGKLQSKSMTQTIKYSMPLYFSEDNMEIRWNVDIFIDVKKHVKIWSANCFKGYMSEINI